jgi:hypothetical protein
MERFNRRQGKGIRRSGFSISGECVAQYVGMRTFYATRNSGDGKIVRRRCRPRRFSSKDSIIKGIQLDACRGIRTRNGIESSGITGIQIVKIRISIDLYSIIRNIG